MCPTDWHKLTTDYREAANLLLQNAMKTKKRNFMVFPTIFLYRHYIELMLKEIILNCRESLGEAKPFPRGHNIYKLWKFCREDLDKIDKLRNGSARSSNYDALEADLNQFATVDPDSEHSRYSVSARGVPICINRQQLIDFLRGLPQLTKRISDKLEGIALGIYQFIKDRNSGLV